MLRKIINWIKSPFRIRIYHDKPFEPEIVSMASFRGNVLIAMRDGTIYEAFEDFAHGQTSVREIIKLHCR